MRAKSALDSPVVQVAAACLVGWFVANALRSRPTLAQPPALSAPTPLAAPPVLPAPQPESTPTPPVTPAVPTLRLEQSVRIECAGIVFEGLIQSIYINDGVARIGLIDHMPDPINETLWSWEDEGASMGS